MKATGIVRRIDDLGRVVIPKEIRKILHIKEGDPLEVFVEDDRVIFQRYDTAAGYKDQVESILEQLVIDEDLPAEKGSHLIELLKQCREVLEAMEPGE